MNELETHARPLPSKFQPPRSWKSWFLGLLSPRFGQMIQIAAPSGTGNASGFEAALRSAPQGSSGCASTSIGQRDSDAHGQVGQGLAIGPNLLGDGTEARKNLSEAATLGHPDAQFNLGNLCYSMSLQDGATGTYSAGRVEAYMWYYLAGAQGHVWAAAACEMLNLRLSDTELQEGNRRAKAFHEANSSPCMPPGT